MKNDNQIMVAAPITNRFFAFMIDAFCVYILRFIYMFISMNTWLKQAAIQFANKYNLLYGKFDPNTFTIVELNYFLNSNLFKKLVIFAIGSFIISMLYNIIFFSTKWSSTIGQKILGIHVISKNGNKMNAIQIISRGILTVLPWILTSVIMFFKFLSDYGVENFVDKNTFLIYIILFLSWYDLIFFTKAKLVLHDLITNTRVVVNNPERYEQDKSQKGALKYLFPDIKQMYASIKTFTKEQVAQAKKMKEEYKKEKEKKSNKK